jgi:general secretion pathway protein B
MTMLRRALPWIAIGGCAWGQTMAPPFAPPFAPASAPAAAPPQHAISAPAPPVAAPRPAYVQPPDPPVASRTPPPPAPPTPPVKGLPPDAPKLVVNGGTFSERRDMRMAIVNGNVVREGTNVDGVVVEQIRPDGLVLAYHGSRYHVAY